MLVSLSGPPSPTDVTAVQDGPTSITVTWTPPNPLDGITGYRISFTGGSDVDIDGGSTNSYTLTGLTNGQTYTISIVATSSGLPSAPEQSTVGLGMSFHTNVGVSVYTRMREHHKQPINLKYVSTTVASRAKAEQTSQLCPGQLFFSKEKRRDTLAFHCLLSLFPPQFHQLQSLTQLQQSLRLPSPYLVVFPVAQWWLAMWSSGRETPHMSVLIWVMMVVSLWLAVVSLDIQ